jgi:SAM-dependent methyltransferase
MTRAATPLDRVTRGTTARHRLRRVDRWLLAARPGLVRRPGLVAVDLGFGATPVTTVELAGRLHRVNPGARVIGLEIDPDRVAVAAAGARPGVEFARGGFDLAGHSADLVRAMNVLRQYDEDDVPRAWQAMTARLRPGGVVVEGTCDERGRLGAWVALGPAGPASLTLAVDLARPPDAVAARLPKALIHRNVPGTGVHALLAGLAARWERHAGLAAFGPATRFAAAAADLRTAGWPVLDGRRRWRRGELTVRWDAVAPAGGRGAG